MALQRLGFNPSYTVEVDPEFPGDGDWGRPVFGFGRDGQLIEPRWGTRFVVAVEPDDGTPWVGMFASGIAGVTGLLGCPRPTDLCVVVDGEASVVSVSRPDAGAEPLGHDIRQVERADGWDLLLLAGFTDLAAVGPAGVAWRSRRLGLDGLKIIKSEEDSIVCTVEHLGGVETIAVDPVTGEQMEGTRFDSYWPPDAPA